MRLLSLYQRFEHIVVILLTALIAVIVVAACGAGPRLEKKRRCTASSDAAEKGAPVLQMKAMKLRAQVGDRIGQIRCDVGPLRQLAVLVSATMAATLEPAVLACCPAS